MKIIFMVVAWFPLFLEAQTCKCIHKEGFRKETQYIRESWWGTSMTYLCQYECVVDSDRMSVFARHSTWWLGSEEGNEFRCDGTVYQQKYSISSQWFYYDIVARNYFAPKKSSSKDLKEFSARMGCK